MAIRVKTYKRKSKKSNRKVTIKKYYYEFVHHGKKYTPRDAGHKGFDTLTAAQEAERKHKKMVRNPERAQKGITLQEILDFRMDKELIGKSNKHIRECKRCYDAIPAALRETSFLETKQADYESFLNKWKVGGKATQFNRNLRYLSALAKTAKKFGIRHNPFEDIDLMPEQTKNKYTPPIKDYWKVVRLAYKEKNKEKGDYLEVARLLAGRIGSDLATETGVNNLKWSDVDWNKNRITIYTRKKKHGHSIPLTYPMSPYLRTILKRRLRNKHEKCDYVFWQYHPKHGRKPMRYGYRRKMLEKLCEEAGVKKFSFHALRRLTATRLIRKGEDLATVRDYLGHENLTTTQKYFDDEVNLDGVMNKL